MMGRGCVVWLLLCLIATPSLAGVAQGIEFHHARHSADALPNDGSFEEDEGLRKAKKPQEVVEKRAKSVKVVEEANEEQIKKSSPGSGKTTVLVMLIALVIGGGIAAMNSVGQKSAPGIAGVVLIAILYWHKVDGDYEALEQDPPVKQYIGYVLCMIALELALVAMLPMILSSNSVLGEAAANSFTKIEFMVIASIALGLACISIILSSLAADEIHGVETDKGFLSKTYLTITSLVMFLLYFVLLIAAQIAAYYLATLFTTYRSPTFDPSVNSALWLKAGIALAVSEMAWQDPSSLSSKTCSGRHLQTEHLIVDEGTSTQAAIITDRDGADGTVRRLYVTFQPSQGAEDFSTNIRVAHADDTVCNRDTSIHTGFLGAYKSVNQRILDFLAQHPEIVPQTTDFPLIATGHSLGGALAMLFAYDVACNRYNLPLPGLISFQSPQPFTKPTNAIGAVLPAERRVRTVHVISHPVIRPDYAVSAPGVLFGYSHTMDDVVYVEVPVAKGETIANSHLSNPLKTAFSECAAEVGDTCVSLTPAASTHLLVQNDQTPTLPLEDASSFLQIAVAENNDSVSLKEWHLACALACLLLTGFLATHRHQSMGSRMFAMFLTIASIALMTLVFNPISELDDRIVTALYAGFPVVCLVAALGTDFQLLRYVGLILAAAFGSFALAYLLPTNFTRARRNGNQCRCDPVATDNPFGLPRCA